MQQRKQQSRPSGGSRIDALCTNPTTKQCTSSVSLHSKCSSPSSSSSKKKKNTASTNTVLTGVIVGFALLRFWYRWYTTPMPVVSCDSDQPFVQVFPSYLGGEEYARLKECTLNHPKLHVESSLGNEAFGKTKGFVVKFNTEGVDTFLEHSDYGSCFGDLFRRMRLPETNAFVFNALLCEVSEYEEWKRNGTAVGMHLDQTVGFRESKPRAMEFLAHQVNVLYVDVAEDMVGGELELWRFGDGKLSRGRRRVAEKWVAPEVNTMVAFRGDSFHQVKAYHTEKGSGVKRLSLVLEQYRIPEAYTQHTIEWVEESKQQQD